MLPAEEKKNHRDKRKQSGSYKKNRSQPEESRKDAPAQRAHAPAQRLGASDDTEAGPLFRLRNVTGNEDLEHGIDASEKEVRDKIKEGKLPYAVHE
jgi:hypothetical protein